MIYGNHNKRRGDIVTVARWDTGTLRDIKDSAPGEDPGAKKFIVTDIMYDKRLILLTGYGHLLSRIVSLDDTNLIRVGRLADK